MSFNQLLDQGVIYNGIPGNNAGGKAYANVSVNSLQVQGSSSRNLVPFNFTASGNITPQEVLNGLITVSTGPATLTFPAGFALALLTLMNGGITATPPAPSNLYVLPFQGLEVRIVNSSAGTVTLASADANTVLFDPANAGAPLSHASRTLNLVFTSLTTPTLTLY